MTGFDPRLCTPENNYRGRVGPSTTQELQDSMIYGTACERRMAKDLLEAREQIAALEARLKEVRQ